MFQFTLKSTVYNHNYFCCLNAIFAYLIRSKLDKIWNIKNVFINKTFLLHKVISSLELRKESCFTVCINKQHCNVSYTVNNKNAS